MTKMLTVAELVELRRAKESELKILLNRIKTVRKEIREKNKQIQANLDSMVMTGSNEKVSSDNFGWENKPVEALSLMNLEPNVKTT